MEYRIKFIVDEDAEFEECNGEGRPLMEDEYAENQYMQEDGQPIPYAEYLRYYGNPDRHIYLQSLVQRKCPACGRWDYVGGTGRIDFMDDDPALRALNMDHWLTPEQTAELPGYLREIAADDLQQATDNEPEAQS